MRFPAVLLAGVAAAVAALFAIEDPGREVWRLVASAALGVSLTFALAVTAERRRWSAGVRAGLALGAAVLLAGLFFAARDWPDGLTVTRYLHLAVAFHLLVAVLPYLGVGSLRGFWQFNRILFLRFLLATLYSGVLFVGLAVALLALDQLFGLPVDDESYARLFVLLAFVFHPWFFLAGLPDELDALDSLQAYPAGLKVFAQFVLIPLVSVYLAILTAYLVRVLVTRTWPSGWIGWLVSSVAAVGTLAILLVHPVRDRPDARWVDAYARWFYVGLLPSTGMLLVAIGLRLGQYGFTEPRYFLLVLALWLTGIALFYALTASRNIRIIPATLAALAFLTFAGPWSAYAVSRRSQADRLAGLIDRNGLPAARGAVDVPDADVREIGATVTYLARAHGAEALARAHPSLQPIVAAALDSVRAATRPASALAPGTVVEALGVDYVAGWAPHPAGGRPFFLAVTWSTPLDIAGFDVMAMADLASPARIPVANDTLAFDPTGDGGVRVRWRGSDVGVVRIDSLLARRPPAGSGRELDTERRTVDLDAGDIRIRLSFRQLSGALAGDGNPFRLDHAEADVLIGVR